jgi:hypothetical protein
VFLSSAYTQLTDQLIERYEMRGKTKMLSIAPHVQKSNAMFKGFRAWLFIPSGNNSIKIKMSREYRRMTK